MNIFLAIQGYWLDSSGKPHKTIKELARVDIFRVRDLSFKPGRNNYNKKVFNSVKEIEKHLPFVSSQLGQENNLPFNIPGAFRYWESPQTFPALFIGPFDHVERLRNLKFAVTRITNIRSTVLSSSEGTAAIILLFFK